MRATVGVLIIGVIGCSGTIGGTSGAPDSGMATVAFTAPSPGTSFTRDSLAPDFALAADVPVAVVTTGPVARVAISDGARALGDVDASGALHAFVDHAGAATLTATAYDSAGASVATATLDVTITDPAAADCHAWLDLYKVAYTVGPANPGVVDPVTVQGPIGGVPYRYLGNTSQRATFFMDCQLALSLAKAAPFFHAHDVMEVEDYGVYNYRCINNDGTPPNCTIGMSQHAYAMAIDLAQFTTSDGSTYNVKTDFVINPDGDTCTATPQPGKDAFLHALICELKGAKVWNIVLTPNYNDLHRDHFHVDLTPGSDYIKLQLGIPVDE
ncbi:MAG TPA: extensin family protein [Kofleriaceae bacterium]|nr:extensin family protein [Kofleriaceae bacterium]